jgi:hypothetical protein
MHQLRVYLVSDEMEWTVEEAVVDYSEALVGIEGSHELSESGIRTVYLRNTDEVLSVNHLD